MIHTPYIYYRPNTLPLLIKIGYKWGNNNDSYRFYGEKLWPHMNMSM